MDLAHIPDPILNFITLLCFPRISHQLDFMDFGFAVSSPEKWDHMKFTKNQSIVILAGVIFWVIMMLVCYGAGYITHEVAHF